MYAQAIRKRDGVEREKIGSDKIVAGLVQECIATRSDESEKSIYSVGVTVYIIFRHKLWDIFSIHLTEVVLYVC